MTNIWVASDHHFGHANMLNFKREDGSPLRDFKDVTEMDEIMVARHNEVVQPQDHVYLLGDFAIARRNLEYAKRLNGKLRLVRGNHDIFKTKEYVDVGFEEIYGVRVWPKHNLIFSHIPLHPDSLSSRNWINVHGHTHSNIVKLPNGHPDGRYKCVCMEQIDYRPVLIMK